MRCPGTAENINVANFMTFKIKTKEERRKKTGGGRRHIKPNPH